MFFFFLDARDGFDSPALKSFGNALETIALRYPNMTIQMMSTLLRIAQSPDRAGQSISISDVLKGHPNQKFSTVARQIDLLGENGMGLLEKRTDPDNRRNRHVAVSAGGATFLKELDLILAQGVKREIPRPPKKVKS